MAAAACSTAELAIEPSSVLRLIRAFLAVADASQEDLPDPEAAGMRLWDLSADAEAAAGLLDLQLLPTLSEQLAAFLAGQLPGQASPPASPTALHASTQRADGSAGLCTSSASPSRPAMAPERVVEVSCGILANLYSSPGLVPHLLADSSLTDAVAALALELTDPPALAELCRLLAAALSSPQGVAVWLPVLTSPVHVTWLLHIVSNTLHPLLLERALLLLAAMLAVAADNTDADVAAAEEQQQQVQQQAQQQLLPAGADVALQLLQQHGLLQALASVLTAAASPGARRQQQVLQQAQQLQAYSCAAVGSAGGGSWSDDDGDLHEGLGQQRVYQQQEVLTALLSCFEQLGQEQAVVAAALQELPALPQQLLQLMLACRLREQHGVLELLLPVLVLFRQVVLPLLVLDSQQQAAARLCLQRWVCIAGVLVDCGPESLDALDAGWYLLAAVILPSVGALQQLAADSGGGDAWILQQLQQLCRCVCGASVPETSSSYAGRCKAAMLEALGGHSELQGCVDHDI